MDTNTFQLGLAAIAAVQVVALAYFANQQRRTANKVEIVHNLVNSLSDKKDTAIAEANLKAGELKGRDFEAAKHLTRDDFQQKQIDANTEARKSP